MLLVKNMRVISGKYKGKSLQGFDIDGTRPTMDRVKESLFGMIQGKLKDSTCLDLFAGSGSLGIEALSNGASKCYFVDSHKEISRILKQNLQTIQNSVVIEKDYKMALKELQGISFDIIFLDPPYKDNLITPALQLIDQYHLLKEDGIIVCEYETEEIETDLTCIKEKKYGSKKIKIYKKKK